MPYNNDSYYGNRDDKGPRGDNRGYRGGDNEDRGMHKPFSKRRPCKFCSDKELKIDFKQYEMLSFYVSERGKIVPRRISGNCAKHQRRLANSIKRARQLALLSYTSAHWE